MSRYITVAPIQGNPAPSRFFIEGGNPHILMRTQYKSPFRCITAHHIRGEIVTLNIHECPQNI